MYSQITYFILTLVYQRIIYSVNFLNEFENTKYLRTMPFERKTDSNKITESEIWCRCGRQEGK